MFIVNYSLASPLELLNGLSQMSQGQIECYQLVAL